MDPVIVPVIPGGTTARCGLPCSCAPVAALVPIADFNALEEAADELLAREAEAVLAEGGPTVTMAELLADLFSERGDGAA